MLQCVLQCVVACCSVLQCDEDLSLWHSRLELVVRAGAGVDNIDLTAATIAGVRHNNDNITIITSTKNK